MCYQPLETDVWDTIDLDHMEDQLERTLVNTLEADLYNEQVEELPDELRSVVEMAQQKARKAKRRHGCDGEECSSSSDTKTLVSSDAAVYRTRKPPDWPLDGSISNHFDTNINSDVHYSGVRMDSDDNDNSDGSSIQIPEVVANRTNSKNRTTKTVLLTRLKTIVESDGEANTISKMDAPETQFFEESQEETPGGWREVSDLQITSVNINSTAPSIGNNNKPRRGTKGKKKKSKSFLYMRQKRIREYDMSEDCLTLNVYAPILEGPQRSDLDAEDLPILVYIHGGSFYSNGGRLYPGEKLATKGIVVVTINYRLGPFGFLSTGDEWARGNWGMLDQRLAVQWVMRHAHVFRGRKDKILLVGNSAGGASVILHLVSPLSRGLFSRAAALSGCALAPWALQSDPLRFAQKLAEDVGCPRSPIPDLLACIRKTDPQIINQAYAENNIQDGLGIAFAPVVEGEVPGAFLPRSPRTLMEEGHVPHIPLIMTLTKDEVTMWLRHKQDYISLLEAEKWMDYLMRQKYPDLEPLAEAAVLHAVRASYLYRHRFQGEDATQPMVPIKTISELMSDLGLRVPCIEEAGILSQWTNLYFGVFSYSSDDDIRIGEQKWIGSYHESDLQFLFGQPFLGLENTLREPQDKVVADLLMDLLIAFAHTGVPELDEMEWPAYNQSHLVHVEMNDRLSLNHNLVQHSLCFWQQFIPLMTMFPIKPMDVSPANPQASPTPIIALTASLLTVIVLIKNLFCLS